MEKEQEKMNTKAKLYTIGFTKRSAKNFFETLTKNSIKTLIDVRLNNVSQLAGYTKKDDLEYFLKAICNINYVHIIDLAPTDEILKRYRNKEITWTELEKSFGLLLAERKPERSISIEQLDSACLLCSEANAKLCHRRLVAEYFQEIYEGLEIIHL